LARLRQEYVQAVALAVEGGGVGALLGRHVLDHPQRIAVDHVNGAGIADGDVQAVGCCAEPDRIRFAADGYLGDLAICKEVKRRDDTRIAGDKRAAPGNIEIEAMRTSRQLVDPRDRLQVFAG
jgi:hypothetical protein